MIRRYKRWRFKRMLINNFREQFRYALTLKNTDIKYEVLEHHIKNSCDDNESRAIFLTTIESVYKFDLTEKLFLQGVSDIIDRMVDITYP